MGSYPCTRNFDSQSNNYDNQRITNFVTRGPHNSLWKNVGINSSGKNFKIAEKTDVRKKRKKYIKNGGIFVFLCHFIIVFAMCILTLNDINIFQQQANVEIVNLMNLPNFIKLIMRESENFGLHIIISCFLIEMTSLYFTKARTNFLDIMSSFLFLILGYLKFTDNDAVEGIFVELALTSMTSVVTFANLVLPKLPKHKTKSNSIMSAFHVDSPSSQCESIYEFSDNNEDEKMDVDEYKIEPENKLLNRLKFRDTTRDDTPIREIRPLLNNFKLDNNSGNLHTKQRENVFSRSNLISNQEYNHRPIFKRPLFTRETYMESKNLFYKSSTVPQLPKKQQFSENEISCNSGYYKIRKSYVYIGLLLLMANTFYNIFSFYQQFRQSW